MVLHTLRAFQAVPRLVTLLVCVAPGDTTLAGRAGEMGFVLAGCGGATRAATVRSGLAVLRERGAADDDWVLVHDAARCLVTPELIDRLIAACEADAVGGLLAQPLADTLKRAGDGQRVEATVPRERLWLAQTPQMFRLALLADALAKAGDAVTDEAGAIESAGHQPLLVTGSAQNFKLTWPEDFALAEALLRSREAKGTAR